MMQSSISRDEDNGGGDAPDTRDEGAVDERRRERRASRSSNKRTKKQKSSSRRGESSSSRNKGQSTSTEKLSSHEKASNSAEKQDESPDSRSHLRFSKGLDMPKSKREPSSGDLQPVKQRSQRKRHSPTRKGKGSSSSKSSHRKRSAKEDPNDVKTTKKENVEKQVKVSKDAKEGLESDTQVPQSGGKSFEENKKEVNAFGDTTRNLRSTVTDTPAPPGLERIRDRQSVPGAVAVAGIGGSSPMELDERTMTTAEQTQATEESAVSILNARVVDEEDPVPLGPFVEAQRMERTDASSALKIVLQSRKVRLVLALVVLLFVGMLVGLIVFFATRSSPDPKEAAFAQFKESLTPLLSSTSLEAWGDIASPQTVALNWFFESNFEEFTFDRQVQRYAMGVVYYATNGREWAENENWVTDDDECTWYQSSTTTPCNDASGTSVIQSLELRHNLLVGTLPDEISLLSSLTTIVLDENFLSGTIPTSIGSCTSLLHLDLSNNTLTGDIPTEIGLVSELQVLDLELNSLDQTIPSEIGRCTDMQYLFLHSNSLQGTVPSQLGKLTRLVRLTLDLNYLSGEMPDEVCRLTALYPFGLVELSAFCSGLLPCTCCTFQEPDEETCRFWEDFPEGAVDDNLFSP